MVRPHWQNAVGALPFRRNLGMLANKDPRVCNANGRDEFSLMRFDNSPRA
jgi:hypothetical protein